MITLDRLVNVLGGYGVVARLGAVPRTAELRRVVIPEPGVTGDVVLAIGADSPAQALGWARDAGAVAAIVRIDVPDDVDDVAVLTVDPAVPWSELAAVVYGLVLEGRETESGRGPTDLFALADSLAAAIGAAVVIEGGARRCWPTRSWATTPTKPGCRPSWPAAHRTTCANHWSAVGFSRI